MIAFEEISPFEHGAGIAIEIDLPEKPAADMNWKSDVLYLDGGRHGPDWTAGVR